MTERLKTDWAHIAAFARQYEEGDYHPEQQVLARYVREAVAEIDALTRERNGCQQKLALYVPHPWGWLWQTE